VFDRTVLGVFALGVDEDGHDLFAGVVADEGESSMHRRLFQFSHHGVEFFCRRCTQAGKGVR
jgi:hypothetical protein